MTDTTRTTGRSQGAQVAIALASTLALACLLIIAVLSYKAHGRQRAVAGQQTRECIDESFRGYGPDVATCIDRYGASAR